MNIFNLQIDQAYMDRAQTELNFPDLTASHILGKLSDAMGGTVEQSQKYQTMKTWIGLLQKKYVETATSIVNGLAQFYKQADDGAISPSEPFYHPQVSYFTENAVSRCFSLAEKLAQLINVLENIGLPEKGSSRDAVSFKKVLREGSSIDLSALDNSLQILDKQRHAHIHGLNPEMTRPKVQSVAAGTINGRPAEFVIMGIDETQLPVTPHTQLFRCKDVMDNFNATVADVFAAIEQILPKP
ncbi:Cthe_2314 family HEPN domain-containing protein [Paenibacillus sp. SI8]|uniref:Cthe_2314 family HEPN domain-containing protein n=1 Tax=unclassified Paenibacillus TaxID=185978 RepID=UPI0034659EEC